MDLTGYLLITFAAMAGGMINALAGGGTLLTFPVLLFLGIPPVQANITNTISLCPGYLGGMIAQRKELKGHRERLKYLVSASVIGGAAGGVLLLIASANTFNKLVPYLLMFASLLLAFQEPLRKRIISHNLNSGRKAAPLRWMIVPIFLASIYGGYFGAGLSVIIIAVLGLILEDSLTRLNALKQVVSLCVNVAASVYFLFSGHIIWIVAIVMSIGAIAGGLIGGRLAGKIKPQTLRFIAVTIGIIVAIIYWIKD